MTNVFEKQSNLLHSLLELDRKIVGIKLFDNKKSFDMCKFKSQKTKKTYCSMVRDASRGESAKISGLNFACKGSARALGMIETDLRDESGVRRRDYGGFRNLSLSRSVSKTAVYCPNIYYGVAVGSLIDFTEEPDVIIIVTSSYNVMRIIQGYGFNYGKNDSFDVIGLGAICQEVTTIPFELNKINVSFLCPGTRMLCQWDEAEVAIGIPYNYFEGIVDGVMQTVNPFERNKKKKYIDDKLQSLEYYDYKIEYNSNYDSGAYRGLTVDEKKKFLEVKK